MITAPEDNVDLSQFSLSRHQLIVIYKTAYYSFYLPVALAMYYVGLSPEELHKEAKSILLPLGEYFQVQDDYLDCFGTPEQIGKIGTDILDNKCSWVVNTALKIASPEQRKILDVRLFLQCYTHDTNHYRFNQDNYGQKNAEAEARVKKVFNDLDIPSLYAKYEQESYDRVIKLIDAVDESPVEGSNGIGMKREVYRSFLNKIYKRQK